MKNNYVIEKEAHKFPINTQLFILVVTDFISISFSFREMK